jgi:hypothetical protein
VAAAPADAGCATDGGWPAGGAAAGVGAQPTSNEIAAHSAIHWCFI